MAANQFKYFASVLTTDEGSVNEIDHNTVSLYGLPFCNDSIVANRSAFS
jgi:hypothetical protein